VNQSQSRRSLRPRRIATPSPPILERHDLITVPAHVLKRTVATEELPPASPSLCTSIVPGAVDAICARTLQTAMDECARENSGLPLRLRAREIADSEIGIARAPGKPVVRELRRSTISVSRFVRLRARHCSGILVDSAGIATTAPGCDAEAEREHANAQGQPPPECLSSKEARRSASGRGRCAGRSHSGPSSVTHLITTTVTSLRPQFETRSLPAHTAAFALSRQRPAELVAAAHQNHVKQIMQGQDLDLRANSPRGSDSNLRWT
jgi:hypothetical protein